MSTCYQSNSKVKKEMYSNFLLQSVQLETLNALSVTSGGKRQPHTGMKEEKKMCHLVSTDYRLSICHSVVNIV